ncbi:MAG: glycosyltransferase [Desulfuromonadaceae bacterium]|nr:glycosyltransferase [Desulfuromonadaceae bacterium]MDD5104166.1 glycosyltransferase [Desulfuromonadaceae bacterium]
MNIMLSYVAYPVTTAVYLERALRKLGNVTTIGPRFPAELIEKWSLQNMKLPLYDQMISTDFTPDMETVLAALPPANQPDLYIWVESVGGHEPINLSALRCPKICYLIDSHLNLEHQLLWSRQFDYIFIAQREYLSSFRQINQRSYWLPLGCDPEIHGSKSIEKLYDVGFVGALAFNPRRQQLLDKLGEGVNLYRARCFWTEMTGVFAASKIVFNTFARNDLNMRFFEALCSGSMLLSDRAVGSGQEELFHDGEDYACYSDATLIETARFYLENDELREMIADRGRAVVLNAHTYLHRMEDMFSIVCGDKQDTFSAAELRERSLKGVEPLFKQKIASHVEVGGESRSFVIPVLDYSPASEFNIATLLQALENISGDVLIVFNCQSVADELKGHPRIKRSAIMTENVGVSRGWNIGVNMAITPNVFILNADLHVGLSTVAAMEAALAGLPKAACVGPQGSFVNYPLTKDYLYFDKGTFCEPIVVDAVSGFLFAVKRELFSPGGLKFEDAYSPCYFEEWDLGLQIKQAGLRSYVIPTTDYTHHWSGTIAARSEIPFMGRSETPQNILMRNRVLFLAKWREIAYRKENNPLFDSNIGTFASTRLLSMLKTEDPAIVDAAHQVAALAPDRPDLQILAAFVLSRTGNPEEARPYLSMVKAFFPGFHSDKYLAELTSTYLARP